MDDPFTTHACSSLVKMNTSEDQISPAIPWTRTSCVEGESRSHFITRYGDYPHWGQVGASHMQAS
jgi:hypothetical protein